MRERVCSHPKSYPPTANYLKDTPLARHKVPRDVVFVDELPRNATGKLLRPVLIDMDVDS